VPVGENHAACWAHLLFSITRECMLLAVDAYSAHIQFCEKYEKSFVANSLLILTVLMSVLMSVNTFSLIG